MPEADGLHYTPAFLSKVWVPFEQAAHEDGGLSERARVIFRDGCLAIGHEERVRNLYKIKNKLAQKAEFFQPNWAQERVLTDPAKRKLILKCRQVGMSTLSAVRALDLALWEPNVSTGIMAHKQDAVKALFENLVKFTYNHFLKTWGHIYSPEERSNSQTTLHFHHDGLGRRLDSSMRVAFSFRSGTISFLHVSEAAFIEDERLLGTLQAVPATGEVIYESTPNGRGGDFYRLWQEWKRLGPQAPYKGYFVPWYEFYPEDPEDPKWQLFDGSEMSAYEREILNHPGITKRHIAWRRWCISANCMGDHERFGVEYPENDIDCFAGGEASVFGSTLIKKLEKNCRAADVQGFLNLDGSRVKLHQDRLGVVFQWEAPKPASQYAIGADPSAGVGRDRAVAYVKNRNTGELVAKLEGHIEPIDFADELVKLGKYFNNAYICVEENNHGHAVLGQIKQRRYPHLYKRKVLDEMTNKPTNKIGFLTNNNTKLRITENLKQACHDGSLVVRDPGLIDEMTTFVQVASRAGLSIRREATSGAHDDRVMAAAFTEEMSRNLGPISNDEEQLYATPSGSTQFDGDTGFPV